MLRISKCIRLSYFWILDSKFSEFSLLMYELIIDTWFTLKMLIIQTPLMEYRDKRCPSSKEQGKSETYYCEN